MKKWILIIVFILVGSLSMGYVYHNIKLNASTQTIQNNGVVTGRIGPAGNGQSFKKGDRFVTDISHNGNNITWTLLKGSNEWHSTHSIDNAEYGFYAMSDSIDKIAFRNNMDNFPTLISTSNLPPLLRGINQGIEDDPVTKRYVLIHTPDPEHIKAGVRYKWIADYLALPEIIQKYAFHPTWTEMSSRAGTYRYGTLKDADRIYGTSGNALPYIGGINNSGNVSRDSSYINEKGGFTQFDAQDKWQAVMDFRTCILLNFSDVVFAVSDPQGTSTNNMLEVESLGTLKTYNSLYGEAIKFQPMKLRLLDDSNLNVTFDKITNANNYSTSEVSQIKQGSKVKVYWSDKKNFYGNEKVSAIIEKKNAEGLYDFIYYVPLSNDDSGNAILDTSEFDMGEYRISLVDEGFETGKQAGFSSSLKSKTLVITEYQPHSISYQKTVGTGLKHDYEYNKNVKENDAIGKLNVTTNSVTIMPIIYEIQGDGDDTFQNFEIEGLGADGSSHDKSFNVRIKSGAPDLVNGSLKTGKYKFCIISQDADGLPNSPILDKTKICTAFDVEKSDLTIAFQNPDETKKSMQEASVNWTETATVSSAPGTKVVYTKVGGDIGLIDIDSDTGAITYNGNGAYGKVKIKASVDDDPSTGLDNYNSAFVEKEIVIYQEVDGHITPDSNSSDSTIPTFTASDPNIKVNGTIGKIIGTMGTPNPIGGTTVKYTYGLKAGVGDANFFIVDSNSGVIKTTVNLGVKSYSITVTVSDSWSTKEIPVIINVGMSAAENLKFYENSTSNVAIATKSVKATDTNVTVYATVKGSTNNNPVTYRIKDGSTNVIEVNPNSGVVTIHGVGTVIIVAEKQGASGQANAQAELEFTVTAGSQNFIYTDNAGNELPKQGTVYKALTEVYAPNKTFQLYTDGNPTGTTVTYQLKNGSPTDVISVDSSGLVTILNASLTNQMGKVIVQATSHDPNGNYSDKTIELPINIEKGIRVISFVENPIYVTNGKGKVTPVTEVDGATDTDGDVLIEVDSNEDHTIAWTNDNKNIDYNYSGDTSKDIKIHATKPMDRNYKLAETDGTLHIMGPDESMLAITSPGQIIYGDHFAIRSTQFDADSTNVKYTFEVDNTTYISNPTVKGNSAEFDALKVSGTNKTTITVTRTADGEVPLSKKVQITVLPKPIEIIIDDKEKLKGEQNPTLTYQNFRTELVSWNGVQDVIQANDIKLSTTANTNSNAGSYPIKGDANSLNKTYPNYSFTFKEGTLTIKEENIEDDWYYLEIDDGSNTEYTGNWTNKDVNIVSDHTEYINLSLDQSTWEPQQVTISKEGETNQSFWMKKDSGAITKEKQEIIRIDKTAPKVKGIKAKDTNNKLQDIINQLSFGIFFKPGTEFEITTDDSNAYLKVSGTKEIAYKVYKTEAQSRAGDELIKDGSLTVSNEKASITISETTGTYKVCVTSTDNAGNSNKESCHEVELKKIDVDIDGDGEPEFNDPDGDGCPDLNIKWKDPETNKWIVINADRNGDGIPDLNIDSDGDGKADLNVDTDNDGKPDINLVILKKSDWKPTLCVKADIDNGILEEYCTGTSVKAKINVDTDNDGIPNINIDNKGDFKPHINISKDGETPTVNLVEIHEWKPKKDYKSSKFTYDSIGKDDIEPELNIDSDGDGRPDINIDLDDDGEADINIDLDGDGIPDIDIDSMGDGVPDVNVDTDGDGKPDENVMEITEWKPGKDVDGDLPYDTMDFHNPDDPSNPDKPKDDTDNIPGDKSDTANIPGDKSDTSVMGQYNPATSMGGANTGDYHSISQYFILLFAASAIFISLICYKMKA